VHIALLTHYYPPEVGAPQRRWNALARRFRASGHRLTVIAPPPHYPVGTFEAVDAAHRAGARTIGVWGEHVARVRFREHGAGLPGRVVDQAVTAADTLATGLRLFTRPGHRPDVVIATAPGLPTIPAGMALGAALRRPTVVEMRDAWPDLIAPSGMLGPDDARHPVTRQAARRAHQVITHLQRSTAAVVTTTESFADVLRERGVERTHVIRNGSSVHLLPVLDPPPLDRPGLRVLYLGTIGRSQGLATAVVAAALARDRGLDLTLRLVGSGADDGALRDLAARLGAPVELVGRVPHSDVGDHYAWADTALVTLRDWAPFDWTVPSKLYEILGVRRHVSAAVRGETATIIEASRGGDVVPPEDPHALVELWRGLAANRRRLDPGHEARAWVIRNAEDDLLAARYLDLLHGVVGR
jgi:colanic acid biosynthesis glycosyl transferase WcaI